MDAGGGGMEGRRRQSGNADVREPENENSENEWGGGREERRYKR